MNLVKLLSCFEEASGLQINLNKSSLFGVRVDKGEVSRLALSLHCADGDLPFTYLGLPIGSNMRRLDSWDVVLDKTSKKLNSWKARSLSMRGRLTLVKSVLSSLPIYFLSLFRMPVTVVAKLERVRNKFLWGAAEDSRKIIWANAGKSAGKFEAGGLGIGSLKAKNLALLAKWWWRYRVEMGSLWTRVINFIYGTLGGFTDLVQPRHNSPWVSILQAGKEIDESGVQFTKGFTRKVGSGTLTKF